MKTEELINRTAADYSRCTLEGMGVEDYIGDLTEIAESARADERRRNQKLLERLKLEVDVVECDCGRPYKDSDLADLINDALSEKSRCVHEWIDATNKIVSGTSFCARCGKLQTN